VLGIIRCVDLVVAMSIDDASPENAGRRAPARKLRLLSWARVRGELFSLVIVFFLTSVISVAMFGYRVDSFRLLVQLRSSSPPMKIQDSSVVNLRFESGRKAEFMNLNRDAA